MDGFSINSGVIGVYIGALLWGVAYNWVVSWLHRNGHGDGLVSLYVAAGTAGTLALAFLIIPWQYALAVVILFAASGAPMIAGSLARYRENLRQAIRDLADGD